MSMRAASAALVSASAGTVSNSNSVSCDKQKKVFKVIVIGDSNVGKTCLTFRFCGGKFPDKTEATIGVDFRERTCSNIEGEQLKLQLWDTAGQERFRKSMVKHYYRNVHAVVFVYDVTKMASFESLPHWIEECNRHNLTYEIPRILIGNKCDCKAEKAVNTNMAQKFADFHNMPVFEVSAKDESEADHIEAIFLTLAHKLKNSKPMMSPPSSLQHSTQLHRAEVISVQRSQEGFSSSLQSEASGSSCYC